MLEESLELPESASGAAAERALVLLVDRLLARHERRGRTLRAVVLGARLVEGGTWRERVVFREALADAARMRLALGQRLVLLPAPAESLRLAVERFGPPHAGRPALFEDGSAQRPRACARRSARRARPRARRRRCACSRSTRTRACPSAARCWRPSSCERPACGRPAPPAVPASARGRRRGRPLAVDGRAVDAVRESWLVEDRWWTDAPLRRRYWEVVTTAATCVVLFRELDRAGGWYRQR